MTADTLIYILIAIAAVTLVLVVVHLLTAGRRGGFDSAPLLGRFDALAEASERAERSLVSQFTDRSKQDLEQAKELRGELRETFTSYGKSVADQVEQIRKAQKDQLDVFSERLSESLQASARRMTDMMEGMDKQHVALRTQLDAKLKELREENAKKLDEMRQTVDEKLQGALEKRLGEAFKQVSERLEKVHQGLGEMQTLASGVGDLKKLLTNVKTRGGWGEMQLRALLEEMLTPDQYAVEAPVRENSQERVDFAIRLPGRDDADETPVLLPIDAKFPREDYERLVDAAEAADQVAMEAASKALEAQVKESAKSIAQKYIHPPGTTDFAVMYLPTEGLFAEVVRRPGLVDQVQRAHRVVIAGPTTFAAILNSLQMGFRTLAIQKRSGEVWQVLGAVKHEFGLFGEVLGKVKKKLQEASNHMDKVDVRSRALTRKLRNVEELPSADAGTVLRLAPMVGDEPPEDESSGDGGDAGTEREELTG